MFSETELRWRDWVETWEYDRDGKEFGLPPNLELASWAEEECTAVHAPQSEITTKP